MADTKNIVIDAQELARELRAKARLVDLLAQQLDVGEGTHGETPEDLVDDLVSEALHMVNIESSARRLVRRIIKAERKA